MDTEAQIIMNEFVAEFAKRVLATVKHTPACTERYLIEDALRPRHRGVICTCGAWGLIQDAGLILDELEED